MLHDVCSPCQYKTNQYTSVPANTSAEKMTQTEHSFSATYADQDSYVTISGYSRTFEYQSSGSPDTYSKVSAPAVVEQPDQASGNNSYSSAILDAITAQLNRDIADGASPEELQSRLEAGLSGFLEGYNDAMSQLEGLPGFTDSVRSGVAQTYLQVMQGIDQLAAELGVESPVDPDELAALDAAPEPSQEEVAAPVTVNTRAEALSASRPDTQEVMNSFATELAMIKELTSQRRDQQSDAGLYNKQSSKIAAEYASYQVKESRSFDFSLTTADGDLVTIEFLGSANGSARWGAASGLTQEGGRTSGQSFNVVGELDDGELNAIKDLLTQVADISDSFFSGDYNRAMELALAMDYDDSEIALFDVALEHVVSEYGEVARATNPAQSDTAEMTTKVEQASNFAENRGMQKSLVADLVEWVSQQTHPRDPWTQHVGSLVRSML